MKQHAEKCAANPSHKDFEPLESECTCDGYHTFDELYEHRITLWITLCRCLWAMSKAAIGMGRPDLALPAWRSKRHSDGELAFEGKHFVLGAWKERGKQMTYHLPIEKWDETEFAETLEKAPEFDGHTSDDVLTRLKNL
jgi:hypothetical protein